MKSIGIDLAGKESNPTGVAVLEDEEIETNILHSDSEIIEMCEGESPDIIAIDAPLSFPEESNLRKADSELIKNGISSFAWYFRGDGVPYRKGNWTF